MAAKKSSKRASAGNGRGVFASAPSGNFVPDCRLVMQDPQTRKWTSGHWKAEHDRAALEKQAADANQDGEELVFVQLWYEGVETAPLPEPAPLHRDSLANVRDRLTLAIERALPSATQQQRLTLMLRVIDAHGHKRKRPSPKERAKQVDDVSRHARLLSDRLLDPPAELVNSLRLMRLGATELVELDRLLKAISQAAQFASRDMRVQPGGPAVSTKRAVTFSLVNAWRHVFGKFPPQTRPPKRRSEIRPDTFNAALVAVLKAFDLGDIGDPREDIRVSIESLKKERE